MLHIQRLRQEVYAAWQWLQNSQAGSPFVSGVAPLFPDNPSLCYEDASFKDSIRQRYGDLRRRQTWEQAAIELTAYRVSKCHLEPHQIVGYLTSSDYFHCIIRKHYGEPLIEAVLQFPEILEVLQDGLEHLYHVSEDAADREIVLKFTRKIARRLFPGIPDRQAA
jgi:hypothetical protein